MNKTRKRKYSYKRIISDDRKKAEHRGEGVLENYRPWIRAQEFNANQGTSYIVTDPYTHRSVHLLSTGEMMAWYILRYDKNIKDIREQFPLDIETTERICEEKRLKHPSVNTSTGYHNSVMTSDFLVDFKDGSEKVYSVKYSDHYLKDKIAVNNLVIEKCYWNMKGIPFIIITREQLEPMNFYIANLKQAFLFSRPEDVYDIYSYIKYMITTHQFETDLKSSILDYDALISNDYILLEHYNSFKEEHHYE